MKSQLGDDTRPLGRVYRRHSKNLKCAKKGEGYTACQCIFWVDWTNPVTKKRLRVSLDTNDQREAERELTRRIEHHGTPEKIKGDYRVVSSGANGVPSTHGVMLREAVREFLQRKVSPTTQKALQTFLDQVLDFVKDPEYVASPNDPTKKVFQPRPWFTLLQLNEQVLEAFVRTWDSRSFADSTKQTYFRYLRTFFRWCIRKKRYITDNPTDYLDRPKHEDHQLKEPLTQEEQRRLLLVAETWDEINSKKYQCPERRRQRRLFALAVIRTMLSTGLRVSDICRMRWSQIDPDTRYLLIRATKKSKTAVRVKIPKSVLTLLRQLPVMAEDLIFHRVVRVSQSAFFTNQQYMWRIISHLGKLAGIPNLSPHKLRHSFAARFLEQGGEMRILQIALGHRSILTTEANYAKFAVGQQKLLDRAMAFLQDPDDTDTAGEAIVNPVQNTLRYT